MHIRLATSSVLEESLDALKEHVQRLSFDDAFGMLTRPAILHHAAKLPARMYFVLFFDIDGTGALNQRLGYEEVNRRVRASFAPAFRITDLVGRWYSGDEILAVIPHDSRMLVGLIARLSRQAEANGLSFTYAFIAWGHPEETLLATAGRVSTHVLAKKQESRCMKSQLNVK